MKKTWLIIIFAVLTIVLSCHAFADERGDADLVFDWAEVNYANYFAPPGQESFEIPGYWVRYYSDTDTYLGYKDGLIYVYGVPFGGLLEVGTLEKLLQLVKVDADGDTYNSDVDCNDADAAINPGATEVLYNGVDDDCNAATPDKVDADGDTYNSDVDCNDADAAINPGATEVLYNGIDDDCNAATPDNGCTQDSFELFTIVDSTTITGTVASAVDVTGAQGAFHFAKGASMAFPDEACLGLGRNRSDFSVSFWLMLDSLPGGQDILGTKPISAWNSAGFSIAAYTRSELNTAYLEVWLADSVEDRWYPLTAEIKSANILVGEWTHVVVTFEVERRVEMFVNLDRRHNGNVTDLLGDIGGDVVKLGDYSTYSDSSHSAAFALSHVSTHDRVLSRDEVAALYFQQAGSFLSEDDLTASADALREHVEGVNVLSEPELQAFGTKLKKNLPLLTSSIGIDAVWALVQAYENIEGAFFTGQDVQYLELTSLADAVFWAQQGLHTYAFTPENISLSHVEDVAFQTAEYFPGPVPPGAPRETLSNIPINGTHQMPDYYVTVRGADARRPTGAYVAPGEIVTIDFPPQAVGIGLEVLVGSHTDVLTDKKTTLRRFGNVVTTVPVTQEQVKVANPFGGLIYVLVPIGTTVGDFEISINDAVRAPIFSSRATSPTSIVAWNDEIKFYQAPWAEFVSDKFMFQLPSTMATTATAPDQVMANWDNAMDAYAELLGRPTERHRAEYVLLDVQLPYGGFGVGYPQIFTEQYSPGLTDATWNPLRFGMFEGFEQDATFDIMFHEFGHAHGIPVLPSESETVVNLPAVYIYNQKLGIPIDDAFKHSSHQLLTRDQAAIDWMIADNFRNGMPMDTSSTEASELPYQHRGYAKYVDIAMLFGWEAVTAGFSPYYEIRRERPGTWTDITADEFVRNVSVSVGENIAPLFHFWGVPPSAELTAELDALGLPRSADVLTRIEHYRSVAPMDASQFQVHYDAVIATIDSTQSIRYNDLLPLFDDGYGQAINDNIDAIINLYY